MEENVSKPLSEGKKKEIEAIIQKNVINNPVSEEHKKNIDKIIEENIIK